MEASWRSSLYLFRNIADIPDGNESFLLDYSILHFGAGTQPIKTTPIYLEIDFYSNLENYEKFISISEKLKDQKKGYTIGLSYGSLNSKGDWELKLIYAQIQRYAILDYMAQNDWARWDYSSYGSGDGRLSNLEGLALSGALEIDRKMNLKMTFYQVNQLIPYGISKETGSRIRLDLDVKL